MKKKFLTFLVVLLLCFCSVLPTLAAEAPAVTANVTLLENGYYIIETCEALSVTTDARSTAQTVAGKKTFVYGSEEDGVLFKFYLYGTFEVQPGVSATCVSTSYTYEIFDSSWKFDSASTWCDGNTACGTAIFKYKVLFITASTAEFDIHLTCDVQGNLYS